MLFEHVDLENKWAFACLVGSLGGAWLDGIGQRYYNGQFPETYTIQSPHGLIDFRLGPKDAISAKKLVEEMVIGNIIADGQIDETVIEHNRFGYSPVLFPAPNNESIDKVAQWFNDQCQGKHLEIYRH